MSWPSNSELVDIISSYYWSSFVNYGLIAIAVMVLYDWVISLPREMELFINTDARPLSACLYFANKYTNIVSQVVSMLAYAPLSTESCARIQVATDLSMYLARVAPALFTGLRAFALSQSWELSIVAFTFSFLPFVTGLVNLGYHPSGTIYPVIGCMISDDYPLSLGYMYFRCLITQLFAHLQSYHRMAVVNRTATIIADILLIAITWWKLRPTSVRTAASVMSRADLMGVLLRDGLCMLTLCCTPYLQGTTGMLYFVWVHIAINSELTLSPASQSVSLIINVVLVIFLQQPPINSVLSDGDQLSTLISPLLSILVSHFMLDLQEAYQAMTLNQISDNPLRTSHVINSSTLNFASTFGSLAAHIDDLTVESLDSE
ncbi:hypothetical protein BD311DRAFT_770977 [Dichomitus squalens]|uniref:DUF6533 domain-containing protein n=1 Tax=Dichomitus squalens TaxID=114155 RepID=A0A4Q9M8U7_9APHY|nr:hypothetical protein BD311DRAFT_770977 [Dichomitus squalens]